MTDKFAKSPLGAALVLLAAGVAACGGGPRPQDPGSGTTTSVGQVGTVKLDTAQRSRIHVEKIVPETYHASVITTGTVAFNGDRSTQVIAPISGPVVAHPGLTRRQGRSAASRSLSCHRPTSPKRWRPTARRTARGGTRRASPTWTSSSSPTTRSPGASSTRRATDLAAATADREAALSQLRSLGLDETAINAILEGKSVSARESAVRAPIAGTLVEKLITPGQLIQAGTTLCFTIADLSTVWVMASVFESDVGAVRRGETALVTTNASPDTLTGQGGLRGRSGGSGHQGDGRAGASCRTRGGCCGGICFVRVTLQAPARRTSVSCCRSRRCFRATRPAVRLRRDPRRIRPPAGGPGRPGSMTDTRSRRGSGRASRW